MAKFTFDDIVLAFAAIQQSAILVQQLATTGRCDETAFQATIDSLYHIDSPDVPSIYGGLAGLRLGLTHLKGMFNIKTYSPPEKQIARYVVGMVHIERRLYHDTAMQMSLKKKIYYAKNQAEFFNPAHPNVIASLSKIYEDTIGKLRFKVAVIGKRDILANSEMMFKIRAVLLAGIRAAVLWQQVGGSRWQLLLKRDTYRKTINGLLQN